MSDNKQKKGGIGFAIGGLGFLVIAIVLGLILFFLLMMSVTTSVITKEETDNDIETEGNVGVLEGDIQHVDLINEKSAKYNVNPALVAAVMKQESGFNTDVESHAGALGLMQIMPVNCTGHGYSIKECKKPENNVDIGAKMIAGHMDDYDDDMIMALAAYNAGVGNVQKYNGVPPFKETQDYVKIIPDYFEEFKEQVKDGEIQDDGFNGKGEGEFSMPVSNGGKDISSPFGMRCGKLHGGIDIAQSLGTNICASYNVKVVTAKTNPDGYGYYIDLEHENGWVTRFAHMYQKTVEVELGDVVKQGDKIAEIGSNGKST